MLDLGIVQPFFETSKAHAHGRQFELFEAGTDEIRTSLALITMAANVEILTFTGSGGLNATGNASANRMTGGDGQDTLNGLDGDDTLRGALGADSLLWLKAEGANMSVRVPVEGRLPAGTKVHLGLDIPKASLFDAKTEQRI